MESAIVCHQVRKYFWEEQEADPSACWLKRLRPGKKLAKAVDDVSIEVKKGEIFGLLGSNGSGKSTLIRLIATLLLPDSGSVSVLGQDVVKNRLAVRRMINRVSVDAAFFKKLSAYENLMYAARLCDVSPRQAKSDAEAILKRLGFPRNKIYASMENLSRGMRQKVAVDNIRRIDFRFQNLIILHTIKDSSKPKADFWGGRGNGFCAVLFF